MITWSVTHGDERVNAKDGLDDTATTIAAPAIAAQTPLAMRRGAMGFLQACPAIGRFNAGPKLSNPTSVWLFYQKHYEKFDPSFDEVIMSQGP